ncbi:helicase [Nocardioides sp. Soil805]|nr:DEAD/DEAH box helicase [Nocardioides sp. Soil805]KRF36976.1 helicase [Nocardioides sp. Soil805]
MDISGDLPIGLHESLVTSGIEAQLASVLGPVAEFGTVDDADLPHVLAQHVAAMTLRRLTHLKDPAARIAAANAALQALEGQPDPVMSPAQQLHALRMPAGPGIDTRLTRRPKTPLNDAALLTNAHGEPSLASELRAEIDSADSIDLLCAFVMWHGLRLIEGELAAAHQAGIPIRVVTTTYIGGTERRALDRLVRDFGAEVKVQYDAKRTRLHAKAWLFQRDTGFDTAYVGSSNLTTSAMLEGVEWNVRLSTAATPALIDKFRATFDTYWNSPEFESYDPDRDRDRLDDALLEAKGTKSSDRVTITLVGLEVRPYPYQQQMLDALEAERVVHDRHRNLVVAATGTGKTVIAALDYRRMCQQTGGQQPRLLFVAHRKEILEQSIRTYREVLGNGSFGELYVGGQRPERWSHVFASVQSLTSYGVTDIPADAYEVVVIDEFHHAEARTYRRLIEHLRPTELLGLTATPERADGTDVRSFFDGRTAAELRLWDALGQDLLCPFHYFAIADGTDLRSITWSRGRYDERELEGVFTGNDARARIILRQIREKVADPGRMRALGFCVSVAHAAYMTQVFNGAGIPARLVTGQTRAEDRATALRELRSATVNVLFTVDVFNEGLDIPDVDTVLFLRPTESATIFMQQLGRGLRRTHNKAVLTVLDFVGYHRREFSFAKKYSALTGVHGKQLQKAVQDDFPFLPSGCQIQLDRKTHEIVLENLRSQISPRWAQLVGILRQTGDSDLATFLDRSGLELSDISRRGSWTVLRREAGFKALPGFELEERLLRRVRAFAHVDDAQRAASYDALLRDDAPKYDELSAGEQRLARMLFYSFWSDGGGFESYGDGLAALRHEVAARAEIRAVVDLSYDAARHVPLTLDGSLSSVPLKVHARYQREEILAALDFPRRPNSFREGVLYLPDLNIDAFFITLKKSEADYSPTTMYADYPISRDLFHWESQSTTSTSSKTGQRYLAGASTVLLFVRHEPKDDFGTAPYTFMGPATYVSHSGERPIAITWKLKHLMPMEFFQHASAIAQ